MAMGGPGTQTYPANGRKIRALRDEQFMTQEALAREAGVSVVRLSNIETGGANVRGDTLKRIAGALGVEPKELLNRNGSG
jgi:transcriptional regulator with XRE-family HTH domain